MARDPGTAAIREIAVAAAEAAGSLLWTSRRDHAPEVRGKGGHGDVVTDLDDAAEKLILARIRTAYPDHTIVAEESGVHAAGGSRWTWLVDPLDGTNNIAIGLPVYVVGISVCDDGIPVVGVVHDPESRQTWSAIRGLGAEGPSGPAVPAEPRVSAAPLLAWTQGHGVPPSDQRARALKLALEARSRRLLQLWAPLMSWILLARGDIDGFVGYRAEAVDLPAGMLIAQEAGLAVVNLDGLPYDVHIGRPAEDRCFVAARPGLLDTVLEWVRAGYALEGGLSSVWPED